KQKAPRRTARSIANQETINATSVTNAQLQVMIDQGVTSALAARDALRSTNGDDSHNSKTGVRRTERANRECLPDMIHESVVASKPKTMQEAIEIATELMDKKIRTFTERETASKRKSAANTNNANNQRGTGSGQRPACYECEVQGHFKRECPKLKNNNNQGNQGERNNALARVYAVGRAGTDPDANVVTDQETINATSVTNAQLQAMIDQGVTAALAASDALKIKFATCTLHSVALTWWNTHVQTIGYEATYGMTWKTLIKMMTEKYCPQNEIRKLEMDLWDLKVKGTDLASYTQRYQELALLCGRMFSEESEKIEKYVGGLPDMIHGSVVASKPKTMQEAIEIATELMDKKICTFAEHETNGPCAPKCRNCNKIGHLTRDCRNMANTNNANNQRGTGLGQKTTCYECGVQGHF
nr:reverse transcriptase domain-containing protein [Tanacetum cinerariifolium]